MKKHRFTLKRITRFHDFYLKSPQLSPDEEVLWLCQSEVEEYFDLAGNEIVIEITLEDPGNPQAYQARIGKHDPGPNSSPSLQLLFRNRRWHTTCTIEDVCKYLTETLKLSRKHQPFWVVLYHY